MTSEKIKMNLHCPIPKLEYDTITLAHGSGGLMTNKLLDNIILEVLHNDILDERHDGATLHMNGRIAMTTDSFVISPIFFPGGDIGELAVNGTVNDLAMCGAVPEHLSLSFIIEEGMKMEDFYRILLSIRQACADAGVQIVTGDTKVVDRGKGDHIYINTTGIGHIMTEADISVSRVSEGDVVIVSNQIAAHGMAILSVREGLEFESEIVSDTCPLHTMVYELISALGNEVKLLKDATRGGLSSILNEVARDSGKGIDLREKDIPIDEQVRGACELLGLDPLYVANEGVFVAIVSPSVAEQALNIIRSHAAGTHANAIGEVVAEHLKQVILQSGIGGRRVVNMIVGEQLPRIC